MREAVVLPPDIAAFLEQPGQLAVLATLSHNGFPHLTPVWHLYAEATIWVWMRKQRQNYRNAERDSRVGLYIQAVADVHKGVTLQGEAQLCETDLPTRCAQIARRYVAPEALEIWVEHMLYGKNGLLQITPVWCARNGSSWNL